MKDMLRITILLLTALLFIACEDVIDVGLNSTEPRLVVEASINWRKGSNGNWQVIRLSTSTDFYNTEIPTASGAEVYITNSEQNEFYFYELPGENNGVYLCENFVPAIGETYTLTILYKNEVYTATETMLPVPDLEDVQQTREGFTEDQLTIKAFFNDPVNETNYYMQNYRREDRGPEYGVFNDEFVNGNYTYAVRIFTDLERGEELSVDLHGISPRYYNYMSKIFITTSEANLGPFQVAPASLRGNVVNETNPDNYAYGYFYLSEVSTIDYIVQ
ncbi:DUF4249 domain-containing protein [Flavobacterium sp. LaA7.5]|nr:DUF4249 domain-containing protein [Flavobacterium salilacus subsp. altitudinum]